MSHLKGPVAESTCFWTDARRPVPRLWIRSAEFRGGVGGGGGWRTSLGEWERGGGGRTSLGEWENNNKSTCYSTVELQRLEH